MDPSPHAAAACRNPEGPKRGASLTGQLSDPISVIELGGFSLRLRSGSATELSNALGPGGEHRWALAGS